ncbi:tetratricopeptide repeat protein 14 isoform X2 [Cynoglossus semilaevis]|uniref:tetratricopeptide repeat protein 14 isoform X2 n=1 Tax=Cynoglossus semilaevis TaxID=244447 RepID=UPI000D6311B7|nr:tetratricopeptide repeat protein 14 isoform X2 [Cynoglossus semilaevis]
MDRDLLRQCLLYHGESLFNKLKCEQTENPDFQALASDLCKITSERAEEPSCPLVEQFIARKADILFNPAWKTATSQREDLEEMEEAAEPYAIMPPLELFMEVPYEEKRSMVYRDLERGDIVVGRINNIREYGFFLTLLCMAGELKRDMEDLDLSALCHIKEIPSTGSHDDPLSYYQTGDFIRAVVKDIDRYQEKITVSLLPASLSPNLEGIKLGVITQEELPIHYSRALRASSDFNQTYGSILRSCHGYHNPCVVDYLLQKVRISDTHPPSMMRGLQSKLFKEEDFASSIRKKQSASWALKCVKAGVDHFKHGRHVEAMNEYNKALEIDTNNVEALVARGALYANKGSILKAITDFEQALESCPDHRNAKKYLCQTLVERGKQLEEQEKLVTAEGLYRRALSLDDKNLDAQDALRKITDTIQKSIRLREEALAKEQENVKTSESSAQKLRKILKEEKRMKKKKKRSASSSSSSSTSSRDSSSSSSSSSRRRSKKKKKKHKKSQRGGKHRRRLSSRDSKRSEEGKREKNGRKQKDEEEVEWYPAPQNTSATFLYQKGGPRFGDDDNGDDVQEHYNDEGKISQLYSLAAASEHEDSDSSRWERKRRESKSSRRRSTHSKSPKMEDRRRSQSKERRAKEGERGKEENRRNSDSKRRNSFEEYRKRKVSCSSIDSTEYSRKSSSQSEYSGYSASKHLEKRERYNPGKRNSFDGGRYEKEEWNKMQDISRGKQSRKDQGDDDDDDDDGGSRSAGGISKSSQNTGSQHAAAAKKDLPTNLLDIFHKIAEFEKEKGVGLKK